MKQIYHRKPIGMKVMLTFALLLVCALPFVASAAAANGNGNGNGTNENDQSILRAIIERRTESQSELQFQNTEPSDTTDVSESPTNSQTQTTNQATSTTEDPTQPPASEQAATTSPETNQTPATSTPITQPVATTATTTTPEQQRENQSEQHKPTNDPTYDKNLEEILNQIITPAKKPNEKPVERPNQKQIVVDQPRPATSTPATDQDQATTTPAGTFERTTNGASNQFAPTNYYIPLNNLSKEATYSLSALALLVGIAGAVLIVREPRTEQELAWSPGVPQSLLES
jgi:hypothetical protein